MSKAFSQYTPQGWFNGEVVLGDNGLMINVDGSWVEDAPNTVALKSGDWKPGDYVTFRLRYEGGVLAPYDVTHCHDAR